MSADLTKIGNHPYSKLIDSSSEEEKPSVKKKNKSRAKIVNHNIQKAHTLGVGRFQQESHPTGNISFSPQRQPILASSLKQESVLQRRVPPLGVYDTVIGIGDRIVSLHGTPHFMQDNEIIRVGAVLERKKISPGLCIEYTDSGKVIMQQQSMRGSSAAAAAMLFLDHGKLPDYQKLRRSNSGDIKMQEQQATSFGLESQTTFVERDYNIFTLYLLLKKAGSAVVCLEDPLLAVHHVVVDEIAEDLGWVRLRDPYHALEMTVTGPAFTGRFKGGDVFQIVSRNLRET